MQVRYQVVFPAGRPDILAVSGDPIRFGRSQDCEVKADEAEFPMVSNLHARIEAADRGFVVVPLSKNNKTLLNNNPIEGKTSIQPGDWLRLGTTGPIFEIKEIEATSPVAEGFSKTIQADARHLALLRGSAGSERFELGEGGVIGRDAGAAQYALDHPHVSRLHAKLAVNGDRVVLGDLGSANGTFVNGRKLARPVPLKVGDRVDIGPFCLRFDGNGLVGASRSNNIELVARDVGRVVRDRGTGNPIALLDGIDLVIRPREFVCLIGPSGSGKSTLLAILSGRNPPTSGTVSVNGEDLYEDFEALKGDIAVVPQKDVLHDSLSVDQALRYTAELRLPPDTRKTEVNASITDILEVVGLTNRRSATLRHLSGGQVKRASLANELISRPSLLFLDEVTSGLDEQTDRDVMEVFRQVADGGKTVVCITHSLANVEATCHLVVILTEGGRLAFFGTPDEAKSYFEVARLGDIYRKLADRRPAEWHDRFRASPHYRRYVLDRMPAVAAPSNAVGEPRARPASRGATKVRQAAVLTRRYISIWRGNRQALLTILGQSVLIAVLLGLVFGKLSDENDPRMRAARTTNLLLLLGVSCFWFGCNTAAKELVKERVIYHRERDFNLRVESYLASKLLILGLIGLAQATILFLIVRSWCGLPGPIFWQSLTLIALALTGTLVGLLISALARSEEVATALVPIVVMPQIILSGAIAPLSGLAAHMAEWLVVVYWGQNALEALLPDSDRVPGASLSHSWPVCFLAILAHASVMGVATVVALRRSKDGANR